ncbi:SH3 domain-containing protein [Capnocytophaga canimorsus]|uniref:SH3 domain-containing protein n=1 Tax=Capnocytophaga canimorsus TaxID=28188 RepID=UPI0037D6F2E7
MRKIILLASILILNGCQFFNKNNNENEEVTDDELVWIDFVNISSFEQKFVTNRKGINLFTRANETAKIIDTVPYGEILEIIYKDEDWYAVRWRIINEEEGQDGWVQAYVKKTDLGEMEDIKLIESDLYVLDDNIEVYMSEETVRDLFQIELIDQKTYNEAQKQRVNYLVEDTPLSVQKRDGVISLTFEDHLVTTLMDDDTDGDDFLIYTYEGEIEGLQKHVIFVSSFSTVGYILFDKRNGKRKEFSGFPHLSPDKKQMISLSPLIHELVSNIEFFEVDENKEIRGTYTLWFKNWKPYFYMVEGLFWATDGYFYMPVNHKAVYWDYKSGDYNTQNCQYIRIKKK